MKNREGRSQKRVESQKLKVERKEWRGTAGRAPEKNWVPANVVRGCLRRRGELERCARRQRVQIVRPRRPRHLKFGVEQRARCERRHHRRHYNCAVEEREHCARRRHHPGCHHYQSSGEEPMERCRPTRRDCRLPRSCEAPPRERRLQNCGAQRAP